MMSEESTFTSATAHGFLSQLALADSGAIRAASLVTIMLNVTLRCDLACAHCHQSCSPSRTEEMSRETMLSALELTRLVRPALLDITGGEPELWPHLRELVALARSEGIAMRVRTNLVALSRSEAADLPELFARNGVALLASLPGTSAEAIAAQRGRATFDRSITMLRKLDALGYGAGDGLTLDIAYNPPLGELAQPESILTEQFRTALDPHGVRFDSLYAIANVPAGRYRQRLRAEDGLDSYLSTLAAAFNPEIARALECRHGLVIGWDGTLSDCDFNLGAGMGLAEGPRTLADLLAELRIGGASSLDTLAKRRISFAAHCYACTAGAGSS